MGYTLRRVAPSVKENGVSRASGLSASRVSGAACAVVEPRMASHHAVGRIAASSVQAMMHFREYSEPLPHGIGGHGSFPGLPSAGVGFRIPNSSSPSLLTPCFCSAAHG